MLLPVGRRREKRQIDFYRLDLLIGPRPFRGCQLTAALRPEDDFLDPLVNQLASPLAVERDRHGIDTQIPPQRALSVALVKLFKVQPAQPPLLISSKEPVAAFLSLASSPCKAAVAAARAPMTGLELCMRGGQRGRYAVLGD
jgi:hypothetical protein